MTAAIITFLRGTGSWPECPDVFFLSLSLLPPEIKKNTAGSRDYLDPRPFWRREEGSGE